MYYTIEKFAKNIAKVSVKTVIKNMDNIPVIEKHENSYRVLKGTRYPCKINTYKIEDDNDRIYVLLKVICERKYINGDMLGIYDNDFLDLLSELKRAKLIYKNSSKNHFGANNYNCSAKGREIIKKNKKHAKNELMKAIKNFTEEVAVVAGKYHGAMIGEYINSQKAVGG